MSDSSPFARWVYRDVTFNVANEDVAVDHEFVGVDPDEIRWTPLAVEGNAVIYRPIGTRRSWDGTTIFLRASAQCRARLILSVEHP